MVVTSIASDSSGLRVIRWSGSEYLVEAPAATLTPFTGLHGVAIAVTPSGRLEVAVSGDQGLMLLERTGGWEATTLASSLTRPDLELLAGAATVDLLARVDGFSSPAFVLHRDGSAWSEPQPLLQLGYGAPLLIAANTSAGTRPAALLLGDAEGVLLARGDDGWSTQPMGWHTPLLSFGYDPSGKLYGMLALGGDVSSQTVLEFHEP